ncbi:hypothetical protein [Propionivibrio sp.]|uniref:hypothetical protein n=1 Tax=Propionivibrio sp. TaxID=2212460 RepID=UPI0039E556BF
MNAVHIAFLQSIEEIGAPFDYIRTNKIERINFPFWSYQEIQDGLGIREDWDIQTYQVPFWGDWHDVLCLDTNTGQVLYLNDARNSVFSWSTTQEFIGSLTNEPATPVENQPEPTLIQSHFSDEFRKKTEAILKRRKA